MQGVSNRRRFIAGAVCPRCGEMDRVVVDLDSDRRECIACGFSQARPEAPGGGTGGGGAPRELPTRVSRAAARRVETAAEPVTLVDPRGERTQSGE
jgi:uncharacterized metal-binding protein (TIGR02443 family)